MAGEVSCDSIRRTRTFKSYEKAGIIVCSAGIDVGYCDGHSTRAAIEGISDSESVAGIFGHAAVNDCWQSNPEITEAVR